MGEIRILHSPGKKEKDRRVLAVRCDNHLTEVGPLNDEDHAFDWLNKALADRSSTFSAAPALFLLFKRVIHPPIFSVSGDEYLRGIGALHTGAPGILTNVRQVLAYLIREILLQSVDGICLSGHPSNHL